MSAVQTLVDLCLSKIADELLLGDGSDDIASVVYELPSDLIDSLLSSLQPLALQKLPDQLRREDVERADDSDRDKRKRRSSGHEILNKAWLTLYKDRWPKRGRSLWDEHGEMRGDLIDDWQQLYWEAHLQDCVDAVSETAMIPSFDGSVGEIQIPGKILEHIGCKDHVLLTKSDFLKFSHHCRQFGVYARHLRLHNALCIAETCELLRSSMLENLELRLIKSSDHVEGLCKLLDQNCRTLRSIDFLHCKFTPAFIDAICASLRGNRNLQEHGIRHFSLKRSSFFRTDISPVPNGLCSIINEKFLDTLTLSDDHLGPKFARRIFNSLLDSSDSISVLDISENNISGFLSQFRRGSSDRIGKALPSLKVLNLRGCNLVKDDADCLKEALSYMPNLESLDLSNNLIGDGIKSLISYLSSISDRKVPFSELRLENCELTYEQATELLETLSTMTKPLNVLSIQGNYIGSKIGEKLGEFMSTGIKSLDIEDMELGSLGFLRASKAISHDLALTHVNISNNRAGTELASFICALLRHAKEIKTIHAKYNLMSFDCLRTISSAVSAYSGTLKCLDLSGNFFAHDIADASAILAESQQSRGKFPINIVLSEAPRQPYDNDP